MACPSFPAQAGACSVAQPQGSHGRARTAGGEGPEPDLHSSHQPLPFPYPLQQSTAGWGAAGRNREAGQTDGSWAIQRHGQAAAPQGPGRSPSVGAVQQGLCAGNRAVALMQASL